MSINMLGGLPLSEIQGPRDDFEQKLAGKEGELWLGEFKRFLRKEPCWTSGMVTSTAGPNSILRPLCPGLVIPATDGQRTLAQAKDVFAGGIDHDLGNWGCDVPDEARPKMTVDVYELTADATFAQMLVGQGDLDKLCHTQGQIIEFVIKHREHLHPQGYATFFPFKSHGEMFVAFVCWHGARRLKVFVCRLSDGYVWRTDYCRRLVLPRPAR